MRSGIVWQVMVSVCADAASRRKVPTFLYRIFDCYIFEILEQMNISLQWHEEVLRPGYHFVKNTSPEMFVLLTFESHCK